VNESGPGHEINLKDVVNLVLEHDLETFGQTCRWPENAKHRSLRKENNLSLSGLGKVNSYEGCLGTVGSRAGSYALIAGRAEKRCGRRHNGCGHLWPPFQRVRFHLHTSTTFCLLKSAHGKCGREALRPRIPPACDIVIVAYLGESAMNLILIILILLLLFGGGGGYYYGGPMVGSGIGGVLLVILIVYLLVGRRG
jgi:hypothetical protein